MRSADASRGEVSGLRAASPDPTGHHRPGCQGSRAEQPPTSKTACAWCRSLLVKLDELDARITIIGDLCAAGARAELLRYANRAA
jgi:hypothetical protein